VLGAGELVFEPRGFALQTYEPTAPGDAFFSVPGTDARGSVTPSAGLALSWAAEPLVLKADDRAIPGAHVVHRQFWGFAQVALPIAGRVLLDATLPAALYQSGSRPFAELPGVTSAAVGDLRLGARVPLPLRLPFELAPGLDVWIPTGSRDAWTSDGTARVQPRLSLSGEAGHVSYGAALGVIVRSRRDPGFAHVGTALTYGGGVAYRFGALRVGPEFYARSRLDGTTSSPMEMLLGARWNRRWIHLGLAAGTGLNRTPGAAPLRLLFQVAVVPAPAPAAEPAPAPPPAAEPVPQPPPTAPSPEPEPAAAPPPALAAEPAPEPLAVKRGGRIELRQQVLFETGRAVIRPESAPLLREVAGVLAEHPEIVKVRIEGHTDAAGAPARNLALSRRRAEAVRRWLVEREGVDEGRLEARGYGQARPIASNGNAAGRVRNRRVDLLVVE